jgi:hypothetical protein
LWNADICKLYFKASFTGFKTQELHKVGLQLEHKQIPKLGLGSWEICDTSAKMAREPAETVTYHFHNSSVGRYRYNQLLGLTAI